MEARKEDGVLIVRPTPDELADPQALIERFEQWIDDGELRLLVNLAGIEYLSSLQVGALVSLHVLAYENVALLKFTGLSEKLAGLFKLLGVDQLMKMHYGGSIDDAFPDPPPRRRPAGGD